MRRNQINSQSLRNIPSSNELNFSPENNKISINLDETLSVAQSFSSNEISEKNDNFNSKKKNQKNKNFNPLTSNHKENKGKDLQYLSPQTNFLTMKIRRNTINDFNEKMEIEREKNDLFDIIDYSLNFKNNITFEKIIKENESYKQNNNLKYLNKNSPYITLKLIDSCVDLRTCTNKYFIGENGIDCSMKNHHNEYISIGRQQINENAIRPNDIMLFPTDPSISRSHFKIFHQDLFNEFNRYKINIDLINRIFKKNKFYSLPYHVWIQIMIYLKPRKSIKIIDNGTIYGTYVEIKNITSMQILINFYLIVYEYSISNIQNSINYFYVNDYMTFYQNKNQINHSLNDSILNPIKLLSHLNFLINNISIIEIKNKIENFLNSTYNNILIHPFSGEYPLNYLYDKYNFILKENQVFLTSTNNGFIIEQINPLRLILSNLFNRFCNIEFLMTFISKDYLMKGQKLDPQSHMFSVTIDEIRKLNLNDFLLENIESPAIQLIMTEGDPCGIMNRVHIVVLINNIINNNYTSFSIGLQKGFLFGKNKRTCFNFCEMDCHCFFYYSDISFKWYISNVSNLFGNNDNNEDKDNFSLYICTSNDKKSNNRFQEFGNEFIVNDGDKIKISESVFEIEYHNFY